MKTWFQKSYKAHMIRPIANRLAVRAALALVFVLLWNRFANGDGRLTLGGHFFPVLSAVFGALVWFSYLGLDGFRPLGSLTGQRRRRRAAKRATGSMADHLDEPVRPDEELSADERSLCSLAANAVCCLLSAILSALSWAVSL